MSQTLKRPRVSSAPTTIGQRPTTGREKPPFISCTQCRVRKIKCTGQRPACTNCSKKSFPCHYDTVVKRRGPDKEPGGRLKPRGTFVNRILVPKHPGSRRVVSSSRPALERGTCGTLVPTVTAARSNTTATCHTIEGQTDQHPTHTPAAITKASEKWWATLFEDMPEAKVLEQLKLFFWDLELWFSFFHRGLFFKTFFAREPAAPAVVFAILAHTTFLHQEGDPQDAQLRALHYANEARKVLDVCLDYGSKEPILAQCALLLVAFEFQPHMNQSLARATAAFGYMETCAKLCLPYWTAEQVGGKVSGTRLTRDIRRVEMQRMCWTLSQFAANSTIWRHLSDQPALDMASADPTRFKFLFPFDSISRNAKASVQFKMSSWILYHRAICLWHESLNHQLDNRGRLVMIQKVRNALAEAEASNDSGYPNYAWQAKEWAIAARGHLGDLEGKELKLWFEMQTATLEGFSQRKPPKHPRGSIPTYSWWYINVAYTALCVSSLSTSCQWRPETNRILSYVYEALDTIMSLWPCTTMEHHYKALKTRHTTLQTLWQEEDVAQCRRPHNATRFVM